MQTGTHVETMPWPRSLLLTAVKPVLLSLRVFVCICVLQGICHDMITVDYALCCMLHHTHL